MMQSISRRIMKLVVAGLLGAGTLACGGSGPSDENSGLIDATRWPRTADIEGATVEVHAPQVISWNDFSDLDARVAVVVTPEKGAPFAATVLINANTVADLDERAVDLVSMRIIETSIPGVAEDVVTAWRQRLEELLPTAPMAVSLEFLLTSLEAMGHEEGDGGQPRDIGPLPELPPIFYSKEPAILVMLDGEPVLAPIDGSGLLYAVNTNWDLLTDDVSWFLRHDDSWLTSRGFETGWRPAATLPAEFSKLPAEEGWAEAVANIPGRPLAPEETPTVFVSTQPAELIITDGQPTLEDIEGTSIEWVTNTDSDLFHLDGNWYLLLSGRWFISSALESPWTELYDVPTDFAAIPPDHVCADVLTSVPGTMEAAEAVRLARVPTKATVSREATATVKYEGEPQFAPIDETSMEYAVNTASDVIRIGDLYYLCFQGVWFVSRSPEGPWQVSDGLPDVITTIPPSSPVYHTTYVQVYDTTPTTVVFGYTAGYIGLYVARGCVVFGTGWYHRPFIYHPPHMHWPIYHGHPVSFGVHAHYNPHTGAYVRGAAVYGPYGGAGRAAAFNPHTGTYARSASAWGPYGGSAAMRAYNPRTGAHGWSHQSTNQYAHWGESTVHRGNEWVHTGHYGDSRGTVAGFETSHGSKGVVWRGDDGQGGHVVKGPGDNVYAGRDGNVYRRTEGGWSKHENGSWASPGVSVQTADNRSRETSTNQASRQRDASEHRTSTGATRQRPSTSSESATTSQGWPAASRQTALQGGFGDSRSQEQQPRQAPRAATTRPKASVQKAPGQPSRPASRLAPSTSQVHRQLERDAWTRSQGAQQSSASRAARSSGQGRRAGGRRRR